MADYQPHIYDLKYWVQNILPQVYDDSLSYQELLQKVVAKLNEVINRTNWVSDTLVNYINETDITEEVNKIITDYINTHPWDETVQNQIDENFVDINANINSNFTAMYNKIDQIKGQVDSLTPVAGETQTAEIVSARVDMAGNTHQNLNNRLEYDFNARPSLNTHLSVIQPSNVVRDKYVNVTTGIETTLTGYGYVKIPVMPGEIYICPKLNIYQININQTIGFQDTNSVPIGSFTGANVATALFGFIAVPDTARYMIINFYLEDNVQPRVYKIGDYKQGNTTQLMPLTFDIGGLSVANTSGDVTVYNVIANRFQSSTDIPFGASGVQGTGSFTIGAKSVVALEPNTEYVCVSSFNSDTSSIILGLYTDTMLPRDGTPIPAGMFTDGKYIFNSGTNYKYAVMNAPYENYNLGLDYIAKTNNGVYSNIVKIGNAIFDGVHDIPAQNIGQQTINKKWVAFGDSVVAQNMWQPYIINKFNIPSYVNLGLGSSCLSNYGSATPMCSDTRIQAVIDASPEILTILGGFNDLVYDCPIGDDTNFVDKNDKTFIGAYAKIIETIQNSLKSCVIQLLGVYQAHNNGASIGTHDLTYLDYNNATKRVAEYYGLYFSDLNTCNLNKFTIGSGSGYPYSNDNIHVNSEGGKRVASVVGIMFNNLIV